MSKIFPKSWKLLGSASLSRFVYYGLRLISFQFIMQILGVQGYAIFMVLISLESFFVNFDFGLGLAYQNQISKASVLGLNLNAWTNGIFRLAILHLAVLSVGFGIIFFHFAPFFLEHLKVETYRASTLGLYVLFWYLMYGLGNIGYRILFAKHKAHLVYVVQMFGGIASFLLLGLLVKFPASIFFVLTCWLAPPAVVSFFVFCYFFKDKLHLQPLPKRQYLSILKISVRFLITSIMSAGVVYVDYLIMAKTLQAIDIASYSVIQKYFSAVFFLFFALLSATWPECSEHMHNNRADLAWKKTLKLIGHGFLWISFGGFCFYLFQPLIIQIFNANIYFISASLLSLFVLYFFVRVIYDSFQMLLQAVNDLTPLVLLLPLQVFFSIYFQWKLSLYFGLPGILLGLIFAYSFTGLWFLPLRFYLIRKRFVSSSTEKFHAKSS